MTNNKLNRLIVNSYNYNFSHLIKNRGKFSRVKVGKSEINKKGMFAMEDIKKGRLICPLIGVVYLRSRENDNSFEHSYQISESIAIEPVNETKFLNHSCNPNAFLNRNWVFEALRDIKKGEEISIDYGCVDYDNYLFSCRCGSVNCRNKLNGLIPKNKNFQKRLGKYFSPYLKTKFKIK